MQLIAVTIYTYIYISFTSLPLRDYNGIGLPSDIIIFANWSYELFVIDIITLSTLQWKRIDNSEKINAYFLKLIKHNTDNYENPFPPGNAERNIRVYLKQSIFYELSSQSMNCIRKVSMFKFCWT